MELCRHCAFRPPPTARFRPSQPHLPRGRGPLQPLGPHRAALRVAQPDSLCLLDNQDGESKKGKCRIALLDKFEELAVNNSLPAAEISGIQYNLDFQDVIRHIGGKAKGRIIFQRLSGFHEEGNERCNFFWGF